MHAAGDHAGRQRAGTQRVAEPPAATEQCDATAHRATGRAGCGGGDVTHGPLEQRVQPGVEGRSVAANRDRGGRSEHAGMTVSGSPRFPQRCGEGGR